MKFLDLFAGIGGFRLGMEAAGHECVGYVEWDKHARNSYEAIHNTKGEWTAHDITSVTNRELEYLATQQIDVICGGFPCQTFSIAGKRAGFYDIRGTMFFEIVRFAQQIKPRVLLLENVKGLLSHEQGRTFGTILQTLDDIGYDCEWEVLNSKEFGVPQNRERVFIVGHLRGQSRREVFPIRRFHQEIGYQHPEVFGENAVYGIEISFGGSNGAPVFKNHMRCLDTQATKGIFIREATSKGYAVAEPGDSVNYSMPNSKTRRGRVGKKVANTLDTGCQQGTVTDDYRIRKLTPRECWRLQGFPDSAFEKAREVNSDAQLYKQAGNSVTTTVVHAIASQL